MGGGLESRCVGRVYGAVGAVHGREKVSLYSKLSLIRYLFMKP